MIRMPEGGSHIRVWHAAALVLIIVAAGYESQVANAYGQQQAIQTTPAKPTTTVSSVISSRQPGSKPEWLLIVPPEEPRPFVQTRVVTEVPLSQWMVKETYPTTAGCNAASYPKPSPGSPESSAHRADAMRRSNPEKIEGVLPPTDRARSSFSNAARRWGILLAFLADLGTDRALLL